MEVTFEDIARTLNASLVSLPGDPSRGMGYAGVPSPPHPGGYRYQAQQLTGDFNRLAVGTVPPGPPGLPPHPLVHPHPHHPGTFMRPPPPPPHPPRPGPQDPHVFRAVSPIPPSLLTGPRNIERQLA